MTHFEDLGNGRWLCPATGLALMRVPSKPLVRVFKVNHGPLNPRLPGGDRQDWSRFDVLGHVTVYGSEHEIGAFCETLAYAKRATLGLDRFFADLAPDQDPVSEDWSALGHMSPGHIGRSWRLSRSISTITVRRPLDRWFVDVLHAETVSALRANTQDWAPDPALRADPMLANLSLITSDRREMTTAISTWLSRRLLADGSEPAGVHFVSKHGVNFPCWASWIPLGSGSTQEEVPALVTRLLDTGDQEGILEDRPGLLAAARILGLRVH